MAHVRAQIRDAVVTAVTGLGATVKTTRRYPTNVVELPRIHVYTMSEDVVRGSMTTQHRQLSLAVEIIATATEETLDDTLDNLAASVETALERNSLGGLVKSLWLTTTLVEADSSGASPVGGCRLTFLAEYHTINAAPTTDV